MATLKFGVAEALVQGRHPTPFDALGLHPVDGGDRPGRVVRALLPWASEAWVLRGGQRLRMRREHEGGLFELVLSEESEWFAYRLMARRSDGEIIELEDPYRLGPVLDEGDLVGFNDGHELRSHRFLGADLQEHEGLLGCRFTVWAPNARAISLIASFNGWDPRTHPMRPRGHTGIWELFVPGVREGDLYKFSILAHDGSTRLDKTDPYGRAMELRPRTASVVVSAPRYAWTDSEWLEQRGRRPSHANPVSIYEVHLGSWKRRHAEAISHEHPGWKNYRELADELLPYVADLGYTHLELLPITEHPYDGSWGYQTVGYFAPTARYGSPDDLRYFVDCAHRLGLGVILDWVPAHFPRDGHGLGWFDGTHLYEHEDPRKGAHPDWGTFIYNYGRNEVASFLISSALYWIEEFHLDGLRVDAVASMLYLDYSRQEGEWIPNVYGGRENLEALGFIKRLNHVLHQEHPDVLCIAEESTAWPQVSHAVEHGGLGFDMKWNMGWMNDTLEYLANDPLFRKHLHGRLTFSILYAFSENFMLPLSHDEVVHGKGSLLAKFPGYDADKFATLRALYGYMWGHPGKKLLFMGGEFAQWNEWNHEGELQWDHLHHGPHRGVVELVRHLNRLYRQQRALHEIDFGPEGFEWIDCHDADRSVLSFLRWSRGWDECIAVVVNFTPMRWEGYRLGLPFQGRWELLLNTADATYDGNGSLPLANWKAVDQAHAGRPAHVQIDLPPLSTLMLRYAGNRETS